MTTAHIKNLITEQIIFGSFFGYRSIRLLSYWFDPSLQRGQNGPLHNSNCIIVIMYLQRRSQSLSIEFLRASTFFIPEDFPVYDLAIASILRIPETRQESVIKTSFRIANC